MFTKLATITVLEVAYHRNGVSGAPFHVVTFTSQVDGEDSLRNMVGIVFEEQGHVSVFDRDALGRGEITFGGTDDGCNSWRGDAFEPELRRAIDLSSMP